MVSQYLEMRFNRAFTSFPSWVPTPTNHRFKRAVRTLNELSLGLVRERRREGRDHGDLLSMLMTAFGSGFWMCSDNRSVEPNTKASMSSRLVAR